MPYDPLKEAQHDWDRTRTVIQHEDDLIDKRSNWMMTFNGILFAALGVLVGAKALVNVSMLENTKPDSAGGAQTQTPNNGLFSNEALGELADLTELIDTLYVAIGTAGLLSAVAGLIGVVAASSAIGADKHLFEKRHDEATRSSLPPIVGFGLAGRLGMAAALMLPSILAAVWTGWLDWVVNDISNGKQSVAIGAMVFFLSFLGSTTLIAATENQAKGRD